MKLNWREFLTPALNKSAKIAVLGIGSLLNCDDAAGMLVIEELAQCGLDLRRILLLAGSTAPENFTGVIVDFAPALLIVVDAAKMGLEPGQIALLEEEELKEFGFSTHMLPFSIMQQYLKRRIPTDIVLLGIEPARVDFGFDISPPVRKGIAEIVDFLTHVGAGFHPRPSGFHPRP